MSISSSQPLQTPRLSRTLLGAFFLAMFIAISSRRFDQVLVPQFWAEDGRNFFAEAVTLGWRSVFVPVSGYLNVAARITACLLSPLPWEHLPRAYNVATCAIMAAVSLRILTARIPLSAAIVGALAVVLIPTSGEVYSSLCCLHFSTPLIFAVNLLEPPPESKRETWRRGLELALAALSGPEVIVVLPLALWRAWQWRINQLGLIVLAGMAASAAVQTDVMLSLTRGSLAHVLPPLQLIPLYAHTLFGAALSTAAFDWMIAVAVAGALACLIRGNRFKTEALILFAGALLFLAAGRSVSPGWPNPFGNGSRYAFAPFVFFTWAIGWQMAGEPLRGPRMIAAILTGAIFASGLSRWTHGLPTPDFHWQDQVAEVRDGNRERFHILPDWTVTVPRQ